MEPIMTTTVVPVDKRRADILSTMPDRLQEVAKAIDVKLGNFQKASVMTFYQIGTLLVEPLSSAQQGTYGQNAKQLLATYLPNLSEDGRELPVDSRQNLMIGLKNWAERFPEATVRKYSEMTMGDGSRLKVSHWRALCRLEEKDQAMNLLKKTVEEGLSAATVRGLVLSGGYGKRFDQKGTSKDGDKGDGDKDLGRIPGRKYKVATPMDGLQRLHNDAQKLVRAEEVLGEHVFDKLEDMEPDKVNKAILKKVEDDMKMVARLGAFVESTHSRLTFVAERLRGILEAKSDDSPEMETDDEEQETPKASGGSASRKASAKPKAKTKAADPAPDPAPSVKKPKKGAASKKGEGNGKAHDDKPRGKKKAKAAQPVGGDDDDDFGS
jgi:hypothetical protein